MYIANLSLCQGYAVATKMYTLTFKSSSLLHLVEKGRPNQCTGVEDFRAAHKHDQTKCTISLKCNAIKYQYQSMRSKRSIQQKLSHSDLFKVPLCCLTLTPRQIISKKYAHQHAVIDWAGVDALIFDLRPGLSRRHCSNAFGFILRLALSSKHNRLLFNSVSRRYYRAPQGTERAHITNTQGTNIYDWKG